MADLDDVLQRLMTQAEPAYLVQREARMAALTEGAELEDADLWPLMLLIDKAKRQVPTLVMDRVHAQRAHHIEGFSRAEIEASVLLPDWQKRQFRDFGYTVAALPMPALVSLPRGRRQLEAVEAQVFEALRVWSFALRAALKMLIERSPTLHKSYISEVDYLAAHAPDLVAISATPLRQGTSAAAKARGSDHVEDHDVLRDFLDQLEREGRRLRVCFATEGANPFFGNGLAERMRARARLWSDTPQAATDLAPLCARAINTLAKGRRLAQAAFEDRPLGMRAYTEGLDKLGDLTPRAVMAAPAQHGKRLQAAARGVHRAQLAEPVVQPPTLPEADRLTASDMAVLAFLADIDPFQITTQHVLLRPEIWAARELGAEAFLRREGDVPRLAALRHLLTEDVEPNAELMKQPLIQQLAALAGTLRQLTWFLL